MNKFTLQQIKEFVSKPMVRGKKVENAKIKDLIPKQNVDTPNKPNKPDKPKKREKPKIILFHVSNL